MSTWPRSHSVAVSATASARMRSGPRVQSSRATRERRSAVKNARPAGRPMHRERQQPREGLGVDQEREADPVEAGDEIAEAEPPAARRPRVDHAAETARPMRRRSARPATGSVRNSTGQALTGASASTDTAPATKAIAARRQPQESTIACERTREPRAERGVHGESLVGRGWLLRARPAASSARYRAAGASRLAPSPGGGLRRDAQPLQPARIGVEHLDLEVARTRHHLAAQRQRARPASSRSRPAYRLRCADVADLEFGADRPRPTSSRLARARRRGTSRRAGAPSAGASSSSCSSSMSPTICSTMSSIDDDAVGAAVFVDHQREMDARRLHLGEQIDRRHRRRHEQHLADDLGRRQRASERSIALRSRPAGNGFLRLALSAVDRARGAPCSRSRRGCAPCRPDRRACRCRRRGANGRRLEHLDQLAERDVLLHRDDVGARHHDVVDPAPAQRQDVREHRCALRGEKPALADDRRPPAPSRRSARVGPVFQPNSGAQSRA